MSDSVIISASGSSMGAYNLSTYLGVDKKNLTTSERETLMDILGTLSYHRIDGETAVAIFKSFEMKVKPHEEFSRRINSFKSFLDTIDHRDNLIDSVKNLGMLSKAELEEQAQQNGDWISVIKRNEKDDIHRKAVKQADNIAQAEIREAEAVRVEVEKSKSRPIIEQTLTPLSLIAPVRKSSSEELRNTLARRTELIESIVGK